MSVPRITQILESEIQARLDSEDAAMRERAYSDALSFAILKELRKIRMILEDETGTVITDDDVDEDEEIV